MSCLSPFTTPAAREANFRQLYGLPARAPEDLRPLVDFSDQTDLGRDDLTKEEIRVIKQTSSLQRYGAAVSLPDLDELITLSYKDGLAAVKSFMGTYASSSTDLVRQALRDHGPVFVFESLANLYPTPGEQVDDAEDEAVGRALEQDAARAHFPRFDTEMAHRQLQGLQGSSVPGEGHTVSGALAGFDLDYAAIEQRILAHIPPDAPVLLKDGSTKAFKDLTPEDEVSDLGFQGVPRGLTAYGSGLKEVGRNYLIQAQTAVDLHAQRLTEIKAQLQRFSEEHGVIVTGLGAEGDPLCIAFPEDMPVEQQHTLFEELMKACQIEAPTSDLIPTKAFSMGCSADEEIPVAVPRSTHDEQCQRIGRIGGRSRFGLLAALTATAGAAAVEPSTQGYAPTLQGAAPHANRSNGEIGRVSPDLAYKLRKLGHPEVEIGDMLCWHVEGLDEGSQWKGIFSMGRVGSSLPAREDWGIRGDPIPMEHLPYKVQRRAKAAKP